MHTFSVIEKPKACLTWHRHRLLPDRKNGEHGGQLQLIQPFEMAEELKRLSKKSSQMGCVERFIHPFLEDFKIFGFPAFVIPHQFSRSSKLVSDKSGGKQGGDGCQFGHVL